MLIYTRLADSIENSVRNKRKESPFLAESVNKETKSKMLKRILINLIAISITIAISRHLIGMSEYWVGFLAACSCDLGYSFYKAVIA